MTSNRDIRAYLLVEHRLRLSSVSRLLSVVTPLALREHRVLALLVLGHLMGARYPNAVE
jgi:hypothetical protein